jgi:cytochrome b subunit of formate dehydrogenase
MSGVWMRQVLHAVNAIVSLVLLGTGFLIEFPELRARLVGGYGFQIAQWHLWLGWLFMAVPVIALLLAGRDLTRHLWTFLGPPDGVTARKVVAVVNLAGGVALAVSGVLLWLDENLPLALSDASLTVHIAFTWTLAALIPLHLFLSRRRIGLRLLQLVGRGPSPEPPDWMLEDGEDPVATED